MLAAELDIARAEIEVARDVSRQAAAAPAPAEAGRFQKAPGLRGRMIRWLSR